MNKLDNRFIEDDLQKAEYNDIYSAHGEIGSKDFDDTFIFGDTPNTFHINQLPVHINGKIVEPSGPELVTNGTFDTDTSSWTANNGAILSVVSGKMRITNGSAAQSYAKETIAVEVGKKYRINIETVNGVGTTIEIKTSVATIIAHSHSDSSLDVFAYDLIATDIELNIFIWVRTSVQNEYVDADNISVKELPAITLDEAPTALVSTDGLAPAGLSQYDFVVTEPQELVVNGTFDTDVSGWEDLGNTTLTVSAAGVEIVTTADSGIGQVFDTVVGREYLVSYYCDRVDTSEGILMRDGATYSGDTVASSVNVSGVNSFKFTALSTQTYMWVRVSTNTAVFDNISVQPVDQIFQLTESSYTTSEALLSSANFTTKDEVYREDSVWLRDDATYLAVKGQDTPDGYSAVSGENNLWSDGTNYAVPVTEVLRKRNKGAYHPVFGKNGCAGIRNGTDDGTIPWYYNSPLYSTSSCFSPADGADNPDITNSGYISSSKGSFTPDGLFYDAIYQHDLKDARISATEPTDKVQLLTDSMQDLVDGVVRGSDAATQMMWIPETVTVGAAATALSSYLKFLTSDSDNPRSVDSEELVGIGTTTLFLSGDNGETMSLTPTGATDLVYWPLSNNTCYLYVDGEDYLTEFNSKFPVGTVLRVGAISKTSTQSSSSIRRCALIGDPANYYRGSYDFLSSDGVQTVATGEVVKVVVGSSYGVIGNFYKRIGGGGTWTLDTDAAYTNISTWQDLGTDREDSWLLEGNTLDAEPLLVAEDGTSLIPDGTTKEYKLPHRCGDNLLNLFSTDSGNTWGITDWSIDFESLANSHYTDPPSTRLYLIFYTSPTTPLIDYETPDEVISEGTTVIASDSSRMVDYTTGKVAVGTDEEKLTILKDKSGVLTHHPSDLDGTGPAAKVAGKLVSIGGRGHVEVSGKELVYDSGNDAITEFTDITEAATTAKTIGTYYNVTDGYFKGVWLWKRETSVALTGTGWFEAEGRLYYSSDAYIYAERWDGNGWGDDNTLDSTQTNTTDIDDNSQTIRISKSLVPLNCFLGDE